MPWAQRATYFPLAVHHAISLCLEERLTRMITVMESIKLSSIFEVHRSRFSMAILLGRSVSLKPHLA
jgi:hypothetical protein